MYEMKQSKKILTEMSTTYSQNKSLFTSFCTCLSVVGITKIHGCSW